MQIPPVGMRMLFRELDVLAKRAGEGSRAREMRSRKAAMAR